MKLIEYLENKVRKFQTGGGVNLQGKFDFKHIFDFKSKPKPKFTADTADTVNTKDNKCVAKQETLPKKFYLQHPSAAEINSFKQVFCTIQKDPLGFSKLFKIKNVLPISSVNGVIMIVETQSKQAIIDNKLLVKIPLSNESDSVTYEYYIGQVLNELRIGRLSDNFALVYGLIIQCGLNTQMIESFKKKHVSAATIKDQEGGMIRSESAATIKISPFDLCIENSPPKPHIIYEYIRNVNTNKTETFDKYMSMLSNTKLKENQREELELNIIKLTIMIMHSLQVAQDKFDFTHYDLHTSNILVIELAEPEHVSIIYKGKNITIMTKVIPHIIDYGRAYVNPQRAQEIINKSEYYDVQLEQLKKVCKFSSFKSYQMGLFQNQNYIDEIRDTSEYNNQIFAKRDEIVKREKGSELLYSENLNKFFIIKQDKGVKYTMVDNIRYNITNGYISYRNKAILLKEMDRNRFIKWLSANIYNKDTTKTDELTIKQDNQLLINKCDLGVHSNKPNKKYDMFRLCKFICNKMLNIYKNQNINLKYIGIWDNLDDQLDLEYPFFNNTYMALPCDYHVTDFFAISDDNINEFMKTYIKEPKNVVEYLVDNISSAL